jgi:hypothetical protein
MQDARSRGPSKSTPCVRVDWATNSLSCFPRPTKSKRVSSSPLLPELPNQCIPDTRVPELISLHLARAFAVEACMTHGRCDASNRTLMRKGSCPFWAFYLQLPFHLYPIRLASWLTFSPPHPRRKANVLRSGFFFPTSSHYDPVCLA